MKIRRTVLMIIALAGCLITVTNRSAAQAKLNYQQMTTEQRSAFVALQAQRIARQMSGREYEFTASFDLAVQKAVDGYAKRIGNNGGEQFGSGDARLIFQRGQTVAPTLIRIFKTHHLSPLFGLYIPLVESEYINFQSPNSVGALGIFQFLPQTGARFGLSTADLLDVEKSANAAAEYIAGGLQQFQDDPMKEGLALLAYNRGAASVRQDLATLVNEQNRACSVCALTVPDDKLDVSLQNERVYYLPRFFAAAIIGENPRAFGLEIGPLSSL